MFNSIQTKIAVPVIAILLTLVFFIVFYASYTAQSFAAERSGERLHGATQAAQAYIAQLERYNRVTSRIISGREDIARLVHEWNNGNRETVRDELFDRIEIAIAELEETRFMETDFVITDINGNVILRTTDRERYGDTGFVSPIIRAAHEGRVESVYTRTERMPMGLSSSSPIRHNGEIIGSVSTINNLASLEFVDEFGEIFNAEVTIFGGSESLASTLFLDRNAGVRAVGTVAQQMVVEAVLENGEPFDVELN
jgi:hypothetical protein